MEIFRRSLIFPTYLFLVKTSHNIAHGSLLRIWSFYISRLYDIKLFAKIIPIHNTNYVVQFETSGILICSTVANFLLRRQLSFTPASHKGRYHNHASTIGNQSLRGCSILSASISAGDREQGARETTGRDEEG